MAARPKQLPTNRRRGGNDRNGIRGGRRWRGFWQSAGAVGFLLLVWAALPRPELYSEAFSYSQVVMDRNGKVLRVSLSRDEKYRIHTRLAELPPALIEATLLHEDRFFYRHPGVNPAALLRSVWHLATGRRRTGGSTITMQLARLRFGLYTRNVQGKLIQILRALQLERHYTKEQLLEAYFNLAPYGGNIEGVGAAAQLYLDKAPAALTSREAVALSVIPQSPNRRRPRSGETNQELARAQSRLYVRFRQRRGLKADPLDAEFTLARRRMNPLLAPHWVFRVLKEHSGPSRLRTTLDLDLQQLVETTLSRFVHRRRQEGIRNATALLADHRTMETLAYVGSADFADELIHGQVDGVRARRSPGSTLKPFVYALAIDQGLIHPQTLLMDLPRSFGGYHPRNYDGEFIGPVSATEALAHSRNIPAVDLASRLRAPTLHEFLLGSGVRLHRDPTHYGLALALGGAELSMEELVTLYGMLANDGLLRPLRGLVSPETRENTRRVGTPRLSPEAAFLTRLMIEDRRGRKPVYWKTGTSHGFRDGWAIALFDRFVLAVWVGNFDGSGNPAFISRDSAAPLLFEIVASIRSRETGTHRLDVPPPGRNLRQVELCAVSGQLPRDHCPHRKGGWFIPGVSPIESCRIHREVLVDALTGARVWGSGGDRLVYPEVYEFWPSEMLELFEQAGAPRRRPPPFEPGAPVHRLSRTGKPPRIVSPRAGSRYQLRADDPQRNVVMLIAETDADAEKIYWFSGTVFLGASRPGVGYEWRPEAGTYRLVAVDNQGRSASCEVRLDRVLGGVARSVSRSGRDSGILAQRNMFLKLPRETGILLGKDTN